MTGLMIETLLNILYIRYTKPILNGVNKSNTLQTKWPPVKYQNVRLTGLVQENMIICSKMVTK